MAQWGEGEVVAYSLVPLLLLWLRSWGAKSGSSSSIDLLSCVKLARLAIVFLWRFRFVYTFNNAFDY